MRRTGFDPFCGISLFREYFTFPKFRGLSGLNLREIAFGSTGVLCPPSAKFLTTFREKRIATARMHSHSCPGFLVTFLAFAATYG